MLREDAIVASAAGDMAAVERFEKGDHDAPAGVQELLEFADGGAGVEGEVGLSFCGGIIEGASGDDQIGRELDAFVDVQEVPEGLLGTEIGGKLFARGRIEGIPRERLA